MNRITLAMLAVALAATTATAAADVAPHVSFSARLVTTDGAPVDGARRLRFSIYGSATGGSSLWTEEADVTIKGGFVYHALGSGVGFTPTLFLDGDLHLEVEVVGPGTPETFSPRLALSSVPYALHAGHSLTAGNASTLGAMAASAFQMATNVSCPQGSFVSRISPDGTTACTSPPPDTDTDTDTAFSSCTWSRTSGNFSTVAVSAGCPQGKHPISGGCYSGNPTTIYIRRNISAGTFNGASITSSSSWYCEFTAVNGDNTAAALCCPNY